MHLKESHFYSRFSKRWTEPIENKFSEELMHRNPRLRRPAPKSRYTSNEPVRLPFWAHQTQALTGPKTEIPTGPSVSRLIDPDFHEKVVRELARDAISLGL
jgi:hypothetical protein